MDSLVGKMMVMVAMAAVTVMVVAMAVVMVGVVAMAAVMEMVEVSPQSLVHK